MSSLSTVWAALQVVMGIGFLIFVHELGHFLVARWNGVRCDVFSIGFGPPIFKWQGKKTEYRLAWIPLGGYVSMAGEHPGQDVSTVPEKELLRSKSIPARMAVFAAGVAMNMLFAVILFSIAFQIGVRFIAPEVGFVPEGSPAWHAGIQPGDRILAIDDQEIINFDQIALNIAFADPGKAVVLKIQRGDEVITREVTPVYQEEEGIQWIGIRPASQDVIKVEQDEPAWKAGIRNGDRIVQIGDKHDIDSHSKLIEALMAVELADAGSGGKLKRFDVVYERDGQQHTTTIETGGQATYMLGIEAARMYVRSVRRFLPADGTSPSLAYSRGLREGDRLHSLQGEEVLSLPRTIERIETWDDKWGDKVTVVFRREKKDVPFELTRDEAPIFFGDITARSRDTQIGHVQPGSAAADIKITPGSHITSIDGQDVTSWMKMAEMIQAAKGKEIAIKWTDAAGNEKEDSVAPKEVIRVSGKVGFGFEFKLSEEVRYGFFKACVVGVEHSKEVTIKVVLMVKALFTRQVSARKLGGPILIAQASYAYVDRFGFGRFLYFLGLLSVNLVILNLLPIPVLDGGHLMFLGIEAVKGSPLSDSVVGVSMYIGFFMILALIVFVIFNDILRILA